jgi:hypothetical protein
MKRKVWLLLVVVPVLLAAYVVKRSLLPGSVRGGEAWKSSRVPGTVAAPGSVPDQSTEAGPVPADLDPFAVLDRQYEAWRTTETARFDEAEARIKARIQPALDASMAKYKLDLENLERMALDAGQKSQRSKQIIAQYEKVRLEIKRTIQRDLDELAGQRAEALDKSESDQARKRAQLQDIQARAESGELDPIAAKQSQFDVLGVSLPASALQPPAERQVQKNPEPAPPKEAPPTVKAIVATADDQFCALIGEALVSEGDTVQGYRVQKIDAQCVTFERDGQTSVQKAN